MYRDGVGEGQFKLVLAHEMKAMREACLELERDGSYNPGITFVCVQVSLKFIFAVFQWFRNATTCASSARTAATWLARATTSQLVPLSTRRFATHPSMISTSAHTLASR